ncbi:hypothetical protein F4678DRAFT_449229 [Xylaria arbuscula]|nr:hypothetical protein F4678DRAFT_449229 [Xylaria arbuscula]
MARHRIFISPPVIFYNGTPCFNTAYSLLTSIQLVIWLGIEHLLLFHLVFVQMASGEHKLLRREQMHLLIDDGPTS